MNNFGTSLAFVVSFLPTGCSDAEMAATNSFILENEVVETAHIDDLPNELNFALSREAIGANPAYLEQMLGVPRIKNDYQMVFDFGGCTIDYGIDGTSIASINVEITEECQPFIDGNKITPATTFGELAKEWSQFIADCLANCGNAADPSISLRFNGSRSNGFISYTYQADYDQTSSAQNDWELAIRKRLGIGRFEYPDDLDAMNCVTGPPPSVEDQLSEVTVSSVYIFSNVEDPHC